MTTTANKPGKRGRERADASAARPRPAGAPGLALVRRNLRRPRELLRKLIVGEALGERPRPPR